MTASEPTTISGNEPMRGDGGPLDALIDFYRAFNRRDLDALEHHWAGGAAPSMDNPIGGIRRGWPAIREGYARLFEGPARVNVVFHDYTASGNDQWHLFVGREAGTCTVAGQAMALKIRTTRWLVRIDGRWRQLHHHGSIEEPAMLAAYQWMIF